MAVKFVVLALLSEKPQHGYAVHALFEERLADLCELNYGQIYQVLTALERQGLVVGSEVQVGRRPSRRVYALSAAGREALRQWLRRGSTPARSFRDEFYLRLYFAAEASPADVGRMVDEELARARGALDDVRVQRDRAARHDASPGERVRRLVLSAAVLHAEATVRALEISAAAFRRPPGRSPSIGHELVAERRAIAKRRSAS